MKRKDEKERFYEETIILYERLQKRKYPGAAVQASGGVLRAAGAAGYGGGDR